MKKNILTILITITTSILLAQTTVGLTIKYSFNNGNANDEVGSNNGSVNGATLTKDRFGNDNYAYSFDGIDDIIHCGDVSAFKLDTNDFSFSFWVKIDSAQDSYIMSKMTGGTEYGIFCKSTSNTDGKNIGGYFHSSSSTTLQNPTESNGSWEHCVVNYDYDGNIEIFINKTSVVSTPNLVNGSLDCSPAEFTIGGKDNGGAPNGLSLFKGSIDDLRVYNRVLNTTDIKGLFDESNPVTPTPSAINDEGIINFTVYPNPFKNTISIKNVKENWSKIILQDIEGKVLLELKENFNKIDLSNINTGVYFLSIVDKKGEIIGRKKLLKNK